MTNPNRYQRNLIVIEDLSLELCDRCARSARDSVRDQLHGREYNPHQPHLLMGVGAVSFILGVIIAAMVVALLSN